MAETPSQHGWNVVNSFADGRQRREQPSTQLDPELERELEAIVDNADDEQGILSEEQSNAVHETLFPTSKGIEDDTNA